VLAASVDLLICCSVRPLSNFAQVLDHLSERFHQICRDRAARVLARTLSTTARDTMPCTGDEFTATRIFLMLVHEADEQQRGKRAHDLGKETVSFVRRGPGQGESSVHFSHVC
jgi:hypothetical protein